MFWSAGIILPVAQKIISRVATIFFVFLTIFFVSETLIGELSKLGPWGSPALKKELRHSAAGFFGAPARSLRIIMIREIHQLIRCI
jgi:hypothetical protein